MRKEGERLLKKYRKYNVVEGTEEGGGRVTSKLISIGCFLQVEWNKMVIIGERIGFMGFFLKIFIYLFMRDIERQRHRQREKQAPHREPDVGLDPRTLRPRPEPKVDAQPLSHPGVPMSFLHIALWW